jgi:UDP-N-acetylmuramate--alanine ligase
MVLHGIKRVFFIGIGGIGMSALARYFTRLGKQVAGYDSTSTPLTVKLIREGIAIHYTDDTNNIPPEFCTNLNEILVIYTPAIPKDHKELNFFLSKNFNVIKRAKALALIANEYTSSAVAGTHGKTSTSTLLAHLLSETPLGCNAFLGGISKNFKSNLVMNDRGANRMVVEADEFDRSFLNLTPQLAIITSADADHLDIYNTHREVKEAFEAFISNITQGGVLIIKKGIEYLGKNRTDIKVYTYSGTEKADFYPINISQNSGLYSFDLVSPFGVINNVSLGVLGRYNVENAIAASAAALIWGITTEKLIKGLRTFKGIVRRFDLRYKGKKVVYIDDYAHHPEELKAAISSAREIFPDRKITGIFQPHLFSRTRDFANEFAASLSQLDELILLPIYPAREEPIPGINSELVLDKVNISFKSLCPINHLLENLRGKEMDVLLTLGAGNIDKVTGDIVKLLKKRGL